MNPSRLFQLLSVLSISVATWAQSAPAQTSTVQLHADWAARFKAIAKSDWRSGYAAGTQLAQLPGAEGYEILKENWKPEVSSEARKQTFKGWISLNHPDLFKVLDLGMNDPSIDVQNWTIEFLRRLTFIDFAEDFSTYPTWYKNHLGRSVHEIEVEGILNALRAARESSGSVRDQKFRLLRSVQGLENDDPSPEVFKAAQFLFDSDTLSRDGAAALTAIIRYSKPPAEYMKAKVISWLNSPSQETQLMGLEAVSQAPGEYDFEPLQAFLEKTLKHRNATSVMFQIGMAFGALKDPRAVPLLIGAIDADNTYDTVYGLGYFGLTRLVGVSYDEAHDGLWWRRWWAKSADRFPESIKKLPIAEFPHTPSYKASLSSTTPPNGLELVERLRSAVSKKDVAAIDTISRSIATLKDYTDVPQLISLIVADNTDSTIYGIGYMGLEPLTGVEYDASHNGPWWSAWWKRNHKRFATDVSHSPAVDLVDH